MAKPRKGVIPPGLRPYLKGKKKTAGKAVTGAPAKPAKKMAARKKAKKG